MWSFVLEEAIRSTSYLLPRRLTRSCDRRRRPQPVVDFYQGSTLIGIVSKTVAMEPAMVVEVPEPRIALPMTIPEPAITIAIEINHAGPAGRESVITACLRGSRCGKNCRAKHQCYGTGR